MKIDLETCIGCGLCVPYCPAGSIDMNEVAVIDADECVECGVCFRSGVCPADCFIEEVHPWPRSVRAVFSNPLSEHKETRVPGRGTEEMKTNDVTGVYKKGLVGMTAEMGRPGVGTRFTDVEKVAQALAKAGVKFAAQNPVTFLMVDQATGRLSPEVLDEKVLSAMIECLVPQEKIPAVIRELKEVAQQIDTVFSLDIITRLQPDGSVPWEKMLHELGVTVSINGKSNIGLGRPLAEVYQ